MDLAELERRLLQLGEDYRRMQKLRDDHKSLQQELVEARKVRLEWLTIVKDTSEDLRKLEGVSLTGLFQSLFGDRKARIHDERDRLLQAKMRHDASDEAIEPLEQQVADVAARMDSLGDVEARRKQLLLDKERLLREQGGDTERQLVESAESLGALRDRLNEFEEAEIAGQGVLPHLLSASSELRNARSWGRMDMIGGGAIISTIKHGGIDRARRHVEAAQRRLADFTRELRDVDMAEGNLSIDIGTFARFADVFLDDLISDWFVQRKIKAAQERVAGTIDRVRDMVYHLEGEKRRLAKTLEAAEAQRLQWIEDAN